MTVIHKSNVVSSHLCACLYNSFMPKILLQSKKDHHQGYQCSGHESFWTVKQAIITWIESTYSHNYFICRKTNEVIVVPTHVDILSLGVHNESKEHLLSRHISCHIIMATVPILWFRIPTTSINALYVEWRSSQLQTRHLLGACYPMEAV